MADQTQIPIRSSMTIDLETRISELQCASQTDIPADLEDNQKRWLVVGICLHSILSSALRKYVAPVVSILYNSLKLSDQIDLQTHQRHLRTYGTTRFYLNYEAINSNKLSHGNRTALYDYKIQNAVDLSKLFLQTHMILYTAFNETCDSSALLGMIINIDKFPVNVQTAASTIRSTIRNPWAHCDFTQWDSGKYNLCLQNIEAFIHLLNIGAVEKTQLIGDLNKWKTNGTSFLQGSTIGIELVHEFRQQIQLLVKYTMEIIQSADTVFSRLYRELLEMGNVFSQYDIRIASLEKTSLEYGSLYDADISEIELWKQRSKLFVETDVFTDILRILEAKHCVLLTGLSGMGKTLTAQNIAMKLCRENEYIVVPCCNLKDIQTRYRKKEMQVFVIDDIWGKYTANIKEIENWMKIQEFVKFILDIGKTKILASCRNEVCNEKNVTVAFDIFTNSIYNLSSKYSLKDKLAIASKYFNEDDHVLSELIKKVEFSPLMCLLYSQNEHFDICEFLNSPYETIAKEIKQLKAFDKEKFCVLLICVIFNGTIDEDIFDFSKNLEKEETKKLKSIFECCNLARSISRSVIKEKIEACVGTYFIKVDKEYKIIHDKMFDFLCCYFGKTLITPIIEYADVKLIGERVQLDSLNKTHGEFTIRISSTDEHKYISRLKTDLEKGKIRGCLNNNQMRYIKYMDKFLDVVKDLEGDVKKRIVNIKDDNGITSFLISCLRGYDELVDIFISVGADVNARNGWFTPLTAACRDGHIGTVEILLNNGSVVNQTNTDGETSLYTACVCGHYGLVKFLIERRADINKKNKYGRSPLYVSCFAGFENIVRILIDKGANIYDSLIGATHGGHDKIVETLITEDCNLNIIDVQGRTALFIACEEGYTKIVTLLINKHADIFKANSDGTTPLYAAFGLEMMK